MTNHPKRHRNLTADAERDNAAAEALAGELLPAEPGDIPPQGSAGVPAHTGNGVPPGLRPNAAKLIGEAVTTAMAEAFPQLLFSAFAAVLSQVPVQAVTQQHMCATCIAERIRWENAHRPEVEKAIADAARAAGAEPGKAQAGRLGLAAFLPPDLRPGARNGMPDVAQAATMVQGTEVCPVHIPGVQAGRTPLLVASAAMSPAMLGNLAGAG